MKTVAIISQKGGAGKTTLAVHLAVAAELSGKSCVIVDLDPQASATSWKDLRSSETPVVVSAQAARLPHVLKGAADHGAALAIIDTAPQVESSALAAARHADLVLIPCRPAVFDLNAIGVTIELAKLAKANACVVLNAVPSRGDLWEQAAAVVAGYGMEVAPVTIGHRAAFMHALTAGQTAQEYEPDGKAAQEVFELYAWTRKRVKL
jgi:chromosome partitioning protein